MSMTLHDPPLQGKCPRSSSSYFHKDAANRKANKHCNHFLNQVNPYVRLAYYDIVAPGIDIPERVIYDYEFLYIKSGHATITVENERFHASPGDFFFFKPGKRHSITNIEGFFVQPHVHFDFFYRMDSVEVPISFRLPDKMTDRQRAMIREDVSSRFLEPFPTYLRPVNSLQLETQLYSLINHYEQSTRYSELQLKLDFFQLFLLILQEIYFNNKDEIKFKYEQAANIKAYIERNLDHSVTMNELSTVFHLDKSHISHIYKAAYGSAPIHYHQMMRVQEAKRMIIYTNLPIMNIAENLGFSSVQDFCRVFRRFEGITPSALRRKSIAAEFSGQNEPPDASPKVDCSPNNGQ